MIRSLYTAASGMMTRGNEQFEMYTHNLANVETPGFKAQYIAMTSKPTKDADNPTDVQVEITRRYENAAPGMLQYTGEELDFAPSGGAFFTVKMKDGSTAYTRNGRLKKNAQGELLDNMGNQVMGDAGPLKVPKGTAIKIDPKGTLTVDGKPVDRLALVTFPTGFLSPRPLGGGLFQPEDGGPPSKFEGEVQQGYFERSNVNVVEEMIRVMESVRSVETYQKLIVAASDDTTGALVRQTGKVG